MRVLPPVELGNESFNAKNRYGKEKLLKYLNLQHSLSYYVNFLRSKGTRYVLMSTNYIHYVGAKQVLLSV